MTKSKPCGYCQRCGNMDRIIWHTFKKGDGCKWLCRVCVHVSNACRKHGWDHARYEFEYKNTWHCACCGIVLSVLTKSADASPNGEFRGIVCRNCKMLMAYCGNEPRVLARLIDYMLKGGKTNS